MNLVFSVIAFYILLLIIIPLPIGINRKSKLMIVMLAFLVGIVGILVEPYLPLWQLLVFVILSALLLSIYIEKQLENKVVLDDESSISKSRKRQIIILKQDSEKIVENTNLVHPDQRRFANASSSTNTSLFPTNTHLIEDNYTTVNELKVNKEVASTKDMREIPVENDWLHELDTIEELEFDFLEKDTREK